MSKEEYFRNLAGELFRAGFWGRRAARLKEDLWDHLHSQMKTLQDDGMTASDAEGVAVERLGAPRAVAEMARLELTRSSWLARHCWMGGFLPAFAGTLLLMAVVMACGLWGSGMGEYFQTHRREALNDDLFLLTPYVANWGVWAVAFAVIFWLSVSPGRGWRYSLAASLGFALAACSIIFVVRLPVEPGTGYVLFCPDTWYAVLFKAQYAFFIGGANELGPLRPLFSVEWARFAVLLALPWVVYAVQARRILSQSSAQSPFA